MVQVGHDAEPKCAGVAVIRLKMLARYALDVKSRGKAGSGLSID
jgi:hypothetical protein